MFEKRRYEGEDESAAVDCGDFCGLCRLVSTAFGVLSIAMTFPMLLPILRTVPTWLHSSR